MRVLVIALVIAAALNPVQAGQLVLNNGDSLSGEFVRLQDSWLYWKSPVLGELKVAKKAVAQLHTATLLKLDGFKRPCTIYGIEDGELLVSCNEQENQRMALNTLKNIEPYWSYRFAQAKWQGKLSLVGTFQRGNKEEDDLDVTLNISRRHGDYRNKGRAEYEAKSKQDQPSDEKWKLAYALDWFFRPSWFWRNELETLKDESKSIVEEYSLSSAFGKQLWDKPRSALSLTAGLAHQTQRLASSSSDESGTEEGLAWQFGFDHRQALFWDIKAFSRMQWRSFINDGDAWLLETEAGLSAPLGGGLLSELRFEYDVDNLPAQGRRREDSKLRLGVGYQW